MLLWWLFLVVVSILRGRKKEGGVGMGYEGYEFGSWVGEFR